MKRVLVLCAAVLAAAPARAQRGVDAQIFRPAIDTYGIFTVDRADVSRRFDFGFRLYANLAGNPLRLTLTNTDDATHQRSTSRVILERQLAIDLGLQLGLTPWLELALDFPVSAQAWAAAYGMPASYADATLARTGFYAADRYTTIGPPDAAPLDARVALKARLFRRHLIGLAVA